MNFPEPLLTSPETAAVYATLHCSVLLLQCLTFHVNIPILPFRFLAGSRFLQSWSYYIVSWWLFTHSPWATLSSCEKDYKSCKQINMERQENLLEGQHSSGVGSVGLSPSGPFAQDPIVKASDSWIISPAVLNSYGPLSSTCNRKRIILAIRFFTEFGWLWSHSWPPQHIPGFSTAIIPLAFPPAPLSHEAGEQFIIWSVSRKDLYHRIPGAGTECNLPPTAEPASKATSRSLDPKEP